MNNLLNNQMKKKYRSVTGLHFSKRDPSKSSGMMPIRYPLILIDRVEQLAEKLSISRNRTFVEALKIGLPILESSEGQESGG